jgi:hypothetical protein
MAKMRKVDPGTFRRQASGWTDGNVMSIVAVFTVRAIESAGIAMGSAGPSKVIFIMPSLEAE